jgi:hypothetical protein
MSSCANGERSLAVELCALQGQTSGVAFLGTISAHWFETVMSIDEYPSGQPPQAGHPESPVPPIAAGTPVPSVPVPDHTEQKENHQLHRKRGATFWVTVVAAAGAVAAAVFTGWSASIARDQERRQLRAYLGFNPSAGIENEKPYGLTYQCHFADPANKSVDDCRGKDTVDVVLKNFGLTPALHLKICTIFGHADSAKAYDVKQTFGVVIERCAGHLIPLGRVWQGESTTKSIELSDESVKYIQQAARDLESPS